MADMQVAVWLGRKAGVHPHALAAAALGEILIDKVFNKILVQFFHAATPVIRILLNN